MDGPHNLSDASLIPIAPELLSHHHDDLADLDPDLATATATVLANQVVIDESGHNNDMLLDADKWGEFAAQGDFYPQSLTSDAYPHGHGEGSHIDPALDINQQNLHGEDVSSKLHGGVMGGASEHNGSDGNLLVGDGNDHQSASPSGGNADAATGTKRKRARRDPAQSANRKRPSMQQDPNDPLAHLLLPPNLQGRAIEYATAPLDDTRIGPVFIHPPQGTVQACVRCHGIKRKCEALSWRLKIEIEGDGAGNIGGMGSGGVIWDKPRCSGCDKADVPCVFELAAASSGFVHALRSEAAALVEDLATARRRIQELEISLAVSQTE